MNALAVAVGLVDVPQREYEEAVNHARTQKSAERVSIAARLESSVLFVHQIAMNDSERDSVRLEERVGVVDLGFDPRLADDRR